MAGVNDGCVHSFRWVCCACGADMAAGETRVTCTRCSEAFDRVEGVWRCVPGFVPPGFSSDRRDRLADIEPRHFWFSSRARLLEHTLDRAGSGAAALELGCGLGGFLQPLASRFSRVVGVDAYRTSLVAARARVPGIVLLEADVNRLPLASGQFDLVAALDVFEHVTPGPFLAAAHRLLGTGGRLLLSVPACPALYGAQDRAMGHRTRYNMATLRAELRDAGFCVIYATHFQCLLFPLFWLVRRFPGNSDGRIERRPGRVAGRVLGAINAAEVRWLKGFRLPWGSSIVAIALKVS